ncbi:MAG: chemotaxis protein CheW [candidate division WOR-3 bacterium]|nr:chemotaxis protein CheW [candidate division WOR-3 bacterium]
MEILSFTLSDKLFGIMVENVKEIVETSLTTSVPLAPKYVEGVMNLRGDPVAIIDLKQKIGFEGKSSSNYIILCSIKDSVVGLRVDDIQDIHEIPEETLKDVPTSIEGEIESKYIKGILQIGEDEYIVIDVDELI